MNGGMYSVPLPRCHWDGCNKPATEEAKVGPDSYGKFCDKHATQYVDNWNAKYAKPEGTQR